MPVTVVLPHEPRPLPGPDGNESFPAVATDAASFVADTCSRGNTVEVWAGTWSNLEAKDNIYTSADSFVRGAYEAWARHMHFAIRPDDVWFAILSQMNCYMGNKKNAEALRHLFVDHKGKEQIRPSTMLSRLTALFC